MSRQNKLSRYGRINPISASQSSDLTVRQIYFKLAHAGFEGKKSAWITRQTKKILLSEIDQSKTWIVEIVSIVIGNIDTIILMIQKGSSNSGVEEIFGYHLHELNPEYAVVLQVMDL